MSELEDRFEAVYSSPSLRRCREYALVLKAVGIEHAIQRTSQGYIIIVAAEDADRSRHELNEYTSEQRAWSVRAGAIPDHADASVGVMGYMCVLLLGAILPGYRVFDADWFEAGKTNAALIRQGEWWRAATALTLHVDLIHLGGNIVIGGLVGFFAGQLLGVGLAWLSILVAGIGGNLLNAYLRDATHTSVGASTAVFAALGLVAAWSWSRPKHGRGSGMARWSPLIGAAVLLGFLGAGGERTDVLAHVLGFFCGGVLGAVYGRNSYRLHVEGPWQTILAMVALLILAGSWALALIA
jgi:rhomboid protease GluP